MANIVVTGRHGSLPLQWEAIELALEVVIDHPLIDDNVVVEGFDDKGMRAPANVEWQFTEGLSTKHLSLPAFRTEWFLQRKHLRFATIDAHRKAYVTVVVGLGGDEGDA